MAADPGADSEDVESPSADPAVADSAQASPQDTGLGQSADERNGSLLPELDVYFPEGRLDFRLSRLIKSSLFEGQFKYNFIRGDVSAFLRYRYYGFATLYQITLFDAIEFENVEELDNDFERVRGLLFLAELPHSYYRRTFFVAELDRITSSKDELRFNDERTNTFVRWGFQLGTPDDQRSNAIVGERRAREERLFTAFRKIGPQQAGLTAALTYSFDFLGADFEYLKLDFSALKRFDLTPDVFSVVRVQGGSFLHRQQLRTDDEVPEPDRFSIPRSELLRLDGRENLKGLRDDRFGTEKLLTTAELFVPWFTGQRRRFLGLDWDTFYWVFYGGYGVAGFDRDIYTDLDEYLPDIGFGFEASFRLKDYTFFLSAIAAQELRNGDGVETHLSIKSYH